jgi:hypothetical protein
MSTAAPRSGSRKRSRPGKVRANTRRHRVSAGRSMASPAVRVVTMKVRTVMPGSRNAAISDCTDWGALKKVLL